MYKLLTVLLLVPISAWAADVTILVGPPPGGQYPTLAQAVTVANADSDLSNNYTINLAPGVYMNDFAPAITRPMTIQTTPGATGNAVLLANVALPNQKGLLLTFAPLTVRRLEITGAFIDNSLGGNGAAIRDQQGDIAGLNFPTPSLTLDTVLIDGNQAGVLQGNHPAEVVTIINSQIINNGNPNICCFTHGIYINTAASLMVQGSMFCGQLIGHDIKSRAAQTSVLNSKIYSAEGGPPQCQAADTSFDIDMPNGGIAIITGNTIVQGASAQNHKMVEYGAEGLVYSNNSATFSGNDFVSTASSIAIEDETPSPCVPMVVTQDNTFFGVSAVVDPPSCGATAPLPPPPPPPTKHHPHKG